MIEAGQWELGGAALQSVVAMAVAPGMCAMSFEFEVKLGPRMPMKGELGESTGPLVHAGAREEPDEKREAIEADG